MESYCLVTSAESDLVKRVSLTQDCRIEGNWLYLGYQKYYPAYLDGSMSGSLAQTYHERFAQEHAVLQYPWKWSKSIIVANMNIVSSYCFSDTVDELKSARNLCNDVLVGFGNKLAKLGHISHHFKNGYSTEIDNLIRFYEEYAHDIGASA